jgi:sulfur-carrier protein adenylyltransferase/sulfurtransferase
MNSDILSNQELRRYHRQIMLPEIGVEGQEKLKKSKVLVVGAGGLGSPVLQYLVAAGVGTIGIADNDLVDETNLQRQILYGSYDLGKQKAIVAKERLEIQNHMVEYHVHNIFIQEENANLICDMYDVIIDATDNFKARYLLNNITKNLEKPLVYGSIYKFEGQVSVFNYKKGASLTDLYPDMPNSSNAPKASDSGLIGIVPGITGCFQVAEALKIITGIGEVLSGKLLIYNFLKNSVDIVNITKK